MFRTCGGREPKVDALLRHSGIAAVSFKQVHFCDIVGSLRDF
ncbi:hypothetical protein [Aeromonas bestiarum]|nr:hypothetical protein [Aeromonas bestiarum]